MGVSEQEYRARIGSFNRSKWPNRSRGDGQGKNNLKLWFSGLILVILLVMGSELRATYYKRSGNLQVHKKKTEESVVEMKRYMEAIEKILAGINLVITRQTEKMKEGNKTMKGLETGLNKIETELEYIKIRQNKCEWKKRQEETV
jgi:hypothetical protein